MSTITALIFLLNTVVTSHKLTVENAGDDYLNGVNSYSITLESYSNLPVTRTVMSYIYDSEINTYSEILTVNDQEYLDGDMTVTPLPRAAK